MRAGQGWRPPRRLGPCSRLVRRSCPCAADRGEALAQIAGGELQQLRLACVHVKLTRYWRKLHQEQGLHGHGHHGAGGGAAALPAIDEVMARLRDQAQLHLQVRTRPWRACRA